jgi:hypothetical protein
MKQDHQFLLQELQEEEDLSNQAVHAHGGVG